MAPILSYCSIVDMSLLGASAAVGYVAGFGRGDDLVAQITDAKLKVQAQERGLAERLFQGLSQIEGLKIIGPPFGDDLRAPTLSFTMEGLRPEEICRKLGMGKTGSGLGTKDDESSTRNRSSNRDDRK